MNRKLVSHEVFGLECVFLSQISVYSIQQFINWFSDSIIPFIIMLLLYRKMKKRMNADENENSFALNGQSRQRNRRALRTIRGLTWLFASTVIPVRIYTIFFSGLYPEIMNDEQLVFQIIDVFAGLLNPWIELIYYMNNILNIFIYAKMIPGFRRFLLTVFTFGMCGRRNAIY